MIKKKLAFLVVLLIVLVGTSCSYKKLVLSDNIIKKNCEEIMEHLSKNEEDGLKKMFCKRTRERGAFDLEVEEAMVFFQGEVVTHDSLVGISGGGYTFRDRKIVEMHDSPLITNIVTDADKTYEIIFYTYLINEEDKDLIGISELSITDIDTEEKCVIGEFVDWI